MKKLVDTVNTSTSDLKALLEFVHKNTLNGYVPNYDQSRKSFGTMVVTMQKFEDVPEKAVTPAKVETEAKAKAEVETEAPKATKAQTTKAQNAKKAQTVASENK